MAILGSEVWRDYDIDGVPGSGTHQVAKRDVRAWASGIESSIAAFQAGGGVVFTSYAAAAAKLTYAADTQAWIVGDASAPRNGIYQKQGASGSGSWVKVGELPYSFYRASNAGAGTANALIASGPNNVYQEALIVINAVAANTSTSVTVAINGADPVVIKTSSGNNPAIGAIQPNMLLAGYLSAGTFRLISDLSSAAIQAAAEAAKTAAEAARDLAIDAADQAAIEGAGDVPTYPSRALAAAASIPTARTYIYVAGYSAKGTGRSFYIKLASAPSPAKPWHFQSADGAYWELSETEVYPEMFGAKGDGVITGDPIAGYAVSGTDDHAALQAHADYAKAFGAVARLGAKVYATSQTINWPTDITVRGVKSKTWIAALAGGTWTSTLAGIGAVVNCEGSLIQLPDLSTNAGKHAVSVSLVSAPTIAADDVLVIYNPTDNSFMTDTYLSDLRPYYRDGEMVKVLAKSGTSVNLVSPLLCSTASNYDKAVVDVYRIPRSSLSVFGVGFHAPYTNSTMAANFSLLTELVLEDCAVRNSTVQSIQTDRCYNVTHIRPRYQGLGPSGNTYAYANSNCTNVTVIEPHCESRWHPIANTGNDVTCCVPTTNTLVRDGFLSASEVTASDAHGAARNTQYIRCILNGGAGFGGDGSAHEDCLIIGRNVEGGLIALGSEIVGGTHRFARCTARTEGSPTNSRGVIDCGGNSNALASHTARPARLVIEDFEIIGSSISPDIPAVKIGTHASLNVPFDVITDGLKGPLQLTEVVRYLAGGSQHPSLIVVDRVSGFADQATLLVYPSGLTSATRLRLMQQSGMQAITCSSGSAAGTHAGQFFRYRYGAAMPHLTALLKQRYVDGTAALRVDKYSDQDNYARLTITREGGGNFTATATYTAEWIATVDGSAVAA